MKRAHLVLLLAGALAGASLAGGAPARAQRPQEAPAATTPKPQPAKTILDAAMRRSARERKPIFLMFDASWWGWCRRLDAAFHDPQVKKVMDANFVVVKLDVMENGDKKATYENPGGQQVMADMGGAKSGLPFYAILDKSGKKLGDSNVMPKAANIGYPGAPEEIVAFGKLLMDTAPRLTPAQLDTVTGYLKAHAPH